MAEWEFLISLIAGLIDSVIWGIATAAVIKNKGYEENWFWWGFFFGIIPFIIACTKPRKQEFETYAPGGLKQSLSANAPGELEQSLFAAEEYVQETVAAGGWQCSCGRANPAYVSTCSCGLSKRQNDPSGVDYAARVAQRKAREQAVDAELKKYKIMLDSQCISQEEYDEKVRELSKL